MNTQSNTMELARSAARTMDTLLGGAEAHVKLRDGQAQKVWVRQLEIEEYPQLLGLLGDERAMLELYCLLPAEPAAESAAQPEAQRPWRPAPAGWARQLSLESHCALIEKAEELNADFFWRWLRRYLQRMERVQPGLTDRIFGGLKAALEAAQSKAALPATSPKSPSSAA